MDIENRPIIFWYGDRISKNQVDEFCSSSLAAKPVQWSRGPSLPSQNVHVDPSFLHLHLSDDAKDGIDVLSHPIAYVYICQNNPKYYADQGKKELTEWFKYLTGNKITDWLIITITDKNKRIPVRDLIGQKLKTDFSIDSVDRLVDLPSDAETYSGAWHALLSKLRNVVLRAFSSTLHARENHAQKLLHVDERNDSNMMDYFILQEEIASLFCCVGLYDDALKCIDIADDYLSEGIALATEDEPAEWVRALLKNSCESLMTTPNIVSSFPDPHRIQRVRNRQANLFELRAHVLSRQCALLQAVDRTADLPRRGFRAVQLALKESRDLKLHVPQRQLNFWAFLCCLQILEAFRRSTPCSVKPELFAHLRRQFLLSNTTMQNNLASPITNVTDDQSNCPSSLSEASQNSLATARLEALQSLELLEDASLQTEGAFHILAKAVYASVVVDDCSKTGVCISHQETLRGTSRWTVGLWWRACVSLGHLGRYLGLWTNPNGDDLLESRDDKFDQIPSFLRSLLEDDVHETVSVNVDETATASKRQQRNSKGSFGAQLCVAFESPAMFEKIYRKLATACIFFQWCSGTRRTSVYMFLELADFYRDGRMFVRAESLYQQATKSFLHYSCPELATYALLQQAFCQQVQWRTENVESIEASVFKRYVQTALVLSITSPENLERCYEQLRNRGSYFANLFIEPGDDDEEELFGRKIMPPWWPVDWWKEALDTVTEHHARMASVVAPMESSTLQRVYPPLHIRSLTPLFQLVLCDLEEANPHTRKQMIRVHLSLIGVRSIFARVKLIGRPTGVGDWTVPPLVRETKPSLIKPKYLHVELGKEASQLASANSSAGTSVATGDDDVDAAVIKESIMRKFFNKNRNGRRFFKKPINSLVLSPEHLVVEKPPKRPTSIDFLGFRGRLNTLDQISPMSVDILPDDLTMSTGYGDFVRSATVTPTDTMSVASDTVFSDGNFRRHKKGFSMTDWSSFVKSFKKTRDEPNTALQSLNPRQATAPQAVATEDALADARKVFFYPRCHVRRQCHCKLTPKTAAEPICGDGGILHLQTSDNYILLETTASGFNLPHEIEIKVYKDEPSAEEDIPAFIFSAPLSDRQYGLTWSCPTLLDRLLPRVVQATAIQVAKSLASLPKSGTVLAHIIPSVYQPIFMTIQIGNLAIPRTDSSGGGRPVGLTLSRASRPDSPTEPLRGQRYTVLDEPLGPLQVGDATMDVGELVHLPTDADSEQLSSSSPPPPSTSGMTNEDDFPPGALLCPRKIQVFKPRMRDQFALLLPTGRPFPIHLCAVNPLVFTASVSNFQRRVVLIQLRVSMRQATCLANGSIEDADRSPFFCQQVVSFRLTSPKLLLKILAPGPKVTVATTPTPATPMTPPVASRSISVVNFSAALDSPAPLRRTATAVGEVGQSVFFGDTFKEGGGDATLGAEETSSVLLGPNINTGSSQELKEDNATVENKLLDPDRSIGIVSHCRPFIFTWMVQQPYFESLLRPMNRADKLGVAASFSLLAGTTIEDCTTCQLTYTANLVTTIPNQQHHTKFVDLFKQTTA